MADRPEQSLPTAGYSWLPGDRGQATPSVELTAVVVNKIIAEAARALSKFERAMRDPLLSEADDDRVMVAASALRSEVSSCVSAARRVLGNVLSEDYDSGLMFHTEAPPGERLPMGGLSELNETVFAPVRLWLPGASGSRPGTKEQALTWAADLRSSLCEGGRLWGWASECADHLAQVRRSMGIREKSQYDSLRDWAFRTYSAVSRCLSLVSGVQAAADPQERRRLAGAALDTIYNEMALTSGAESAPVVEEVAAGSVCMYQGGSWEGAECVHYMLDDASSILTACTVFLRLEVLGRAGPLDPVVTDRHAMLSLRARACVGWANRLEAEEWDRPLESLRELEQQ